MPVHAVKDSNGAVIGWQYGEHGKVYKGKGARQKAEAQGIAIRMQQHDETMESARKKIYRED